jgi:hypothetical protein
MARHWPFAVVFAAGLALRAAAAIAYRPALVYIDTPRYLGGDQGGLDPLGYTYLLLRPVLLAGGGLTGVAIIQHALGLAMAACMYTLATRYGAGRWLAALAAAPVLLDAYQVQAEQTIMPDVAFEALVVAATTVLLWPRRPATADVGDAAEPRSLSITARGDDPAGQGSPGGARADVPRLVCGAALLGLAATVRQVGELLVLPLLVYALVMVPRWRPRAVRAAVVLGVFAVPVVAYMAISSAVLGTGFRLSNMNDAYLYGRVAHAADCATLRVPGYERPLCPSPSTAAALGVDGLATDPSSAVFTYRPPPGVSRSAAIAGFDKAVLTQQPLRVAADIAGDAVKVFALTRDTAQGDPPVSRWQFQRQYPVYRAADRAVLGAGAAPHATAPLAAALRAYQLHGGFTPGPLLLAFLVAGTAGCFARRRHPAQAAGCLLVTGLAVAAAGGADLYEFSWRYQLPALVTLPLAGALGASVFLRLAVTRWSGGDGRMIAWTMTRASLRSGPSRAASSTPTTGSASARTTSSAATAPGAPTPS